MLFCRSIIVHDFVISGQNNTYYNNNLNEKLVCIIAIVANAGWSTKKDNVEAAENDGSESNKMCVAIVVRSDLTDDLSKLVDISSRTLLGQFKKLYKRRDSALRQWEETSGHAITVYTCSSQDVLTSVQTAARAMTVPTHTFVNKTPTHGKSRSAIVVGPVGWDKLQDIVGKLEILH